MRKLQLYVTATLADDADPEAAAEAAFDHLCHSARDTDTPGVESFDNYDYEVED